MLRLHNTLSKKIEEFSPLNDSKVSMYACGPTVYDYTHIGHLYKYIGDDILRRVLKVNGYEVLHVMNITDVGHLVSDADAGEDKLEKGAKERDLNVWEVAKFFEEYFLKTINQVNILLPNIICRATEHIEEQIKLIKKLEEKGYTYQTDEAIYFDVSKFPTYGELTGQKLEDKKTGVRDEVIVDTKKKNPVDFALWFFTIGRFGSHVMKWPSPWGDGFPGWHIECSAMSMQYLGNTLDIHTGGIDHIPVHHTNEIAQSEAATDHKFVRFWVHHNFLNIADEKMSKSKKNFYTLEDIKAKGFDPLALRYLFLTGHYRDELKFSWESLQAAQKTLNNLREDMRDWGTGNLYSSVSPQNDIYQKFLEALNNDLNTPQALAVLHEVVKSSLSDSEKAVTVLEMSKVLGLGLEEFIGKQIEVPKAVQKLIDQREQARKSGDFEKSDQLRKKIKDFGFEIEDTPNGLRLRKFF
jgi:cysteinyl-tRNA synthetase